MDLSQATIGRNPLKTLERVKGNRTLVIKLGALARAWRLDRTAPRPPRFRPGDRARVLHGPFAGLTGFCTTARPVEVLLAILGGAQRVTLAVDAVEPAR